MKTDEKAELIAAAQAASADAGGDFWEEVQRRLDELEADDKNLVKPRRERE
jgi:hypothetical protein